MVNRLNADIKAAVSLIIKEDFSVLRNIIKKSGNIPSKTGFKIKKENRNQKQ
jgi:hypothetical protein